MEKQTASNKALTIFLVCVLIGTIIYTYDAVQKSQLPFGEKSLKGYEYLATQPNNSTTGIIIQYFRKNDISTDCALKEVTTDKTLETLYSGKVLAANIKDMSLDNRLTEKGTGKYLFDTKQYTYFSNYCNPSSGSVTK